MDKHIQIFISIGIGVLVGVISHIINEGKAPALFIKIFGEWKPRTVAAISRIIEGIIVGLVVGLILLCCKSCSEKLGPGATPQPSNTPPSTVSPEPFSSPESTPNNKPVPGTTVSETPCEADLLAVNQNDSYPNDIVLPKSRSYLPEYCTKYVKSGRGDSIYLYWSPKGGDTLRNHYVYEKTPVTVLAEEGNYSCIIFLKKEDIPILGWVNSKYLVDDYDEAS